MRAHASGGKIVLLALLASSLGSAAGYQIGIGEARVFEGAQALVLSGDVAGARTLRLDALASRGSLDGMAVARVRHLSQDVLEEWQNEWFGTVIQQYPNDLMTYQRMLWDVRPDVIIETGTLSGGLTLYLSMLLDHIKPEARIYTVDLDSAGWDSLSARDEPGLVHLLERIEFVKGSSTALATLSHIQAGIRPGQTVLVILDSLHTRDHVLDEMKLYGPLVTVGSYLVVNDTHLDGTKWTGFAPGPRAAVDAYLKTTAAFEIDTARNRYLITCNNAGILRRSK